MQCCDAIRLPGQPQTVNFLLLYCSEAEVFIPQVIFTFWLNKELGFFFEDSSVKRCPWNILLMNKSIQHCMLLFPNTCYIVANWLIAENSLLLQVEVFQSCPLGKGIFVKGNLYKWEMCSLFKFRRAWSFFLRQPPFPLSHFLPHTYKHTHTHTHTRAHFQYAHSFYSPNSDCEMTQYFNQLYLICTLAEDRATCVLLLPWLALSMPTGCLWAALDCHACQSLWPTRRVRLQSIPP